VDFTISTRTTRSIAIQYAAEMGNHIHNGFVKFFAGCPWEDQESSLQATKDLLRPAENFGPLASPQLAVVPGPKTPFKDDLYKQTIENMKVLVHDFEMISICSSCSSKVTSDVRAVGGKERLIDFLVELPAWKELELDFLSTLGLVRRCVDILLHHDSEEVIEDREMDEVERISLFDLSAITNVLAEVLVILGQEFLTLHSDASSSHKASISIEPGETARDNSNEESPMMVSTSSSSEIRHGATFCASLTLREVLQGSPAHRAGMTEEHKGWLLTHVQGREVTPRDHLPAWPSDSNDKIHLELRKPQALWQDPRVRLVVILKALRNARQSVGTIGAACIRMNLH
jgi:hypothetical protein